MIDIYKYKLKEERGYSYIGNFSEGLAWFRKDGKSGFVNEEAEEVIPCKYDDAHRFYEGLAGVKKDGKWFNIDRFENAYYTEQEIKMFKTANESIQEMKNKAIKAIENATLEEAKRIKEELAEGIQTKRAELAERINQLREEQEKTEKKKIINDIQSL